MRSAGNIAPTWRPAMPYRRENGRAEGTAGGKRPPSFLARTLLKSVNGSAPYGPFRVQRGAWASSNAADRPSHTWGSASGFFCAPPIRGRGVMEIAHECQILDRR